MAEAVLLKPDRKFVEAIIASGGDDLMQCYQCATCSVVCELSNGRTPFPRKEMLWAQWGLKDRLVGDPDVWLCHQCNDCSTRCPRGARPGDVLAAVRQYTVRHYAAPRFLADWVSRIRYFPLVFVLLPALLLAGALVAREPLETALGLGGEHEAFYAAFFPHWLLIGFFAFFTTLAFLGAVVGVVRFWRAMRHADGVSGAPPPALGVVSSAVRIVRSIMVHDKFRQCTDRASRRSTHVLAFYGFAALFVVTVWATIDLYFLPVLGIDSLYPFGLLHPMKMVANVAGVLLLVGCVKAIRDRLDRARDATTGTVFDWTFVWLLLSVAATGFVTEVFRFVVDPAERAVVEYTAYAIYYVHLVLVFGLLVYLPYSKFAHIIYRTAAMVYAEHSGRNQNGRQLVRVAPQ